MEISVKDILRIIKKNLAIIIIFTLVLSLASFFISKFVIKKTYTATAKLYVSADYSSANTYSDLNTRNYASKMVATYIQMLDTNRFYGEVSEALNERYTAGQLKGMISFSSVEDVEVFSVSVVCDSPSEAKRICDTVTEVAPSTINELISGNQSNTAGLKIVDDAVTPTAPTSPNVTRNVLIAFVLGLFISLVFAFARDYFDIKVKFDEDMTTLCGLPVLAAIPDFSYFADSARAAKKEQQSKSGE